MSRHSRSRPAAPRAATPPPRPDRPNAPVLPSLREVLDPWGPFFIPLLLLAITRFVVWVQIPGGAEDAYITYRFSRNLAEGHGLVYNLGERVMGFSSPVWVVWNALGQWVTHQPLLWSRVTALGADVVTLLIVGALLVRSASVASAWCFTFFFAVWPYFANVSMSGMESSLMLSLIPLSAALVAVRSPGGGVALAALALVRPEGVAAAAIVAIGARWRERLVALALAALGYGALAAYFGTVLPQSVVAKALTYGTLGPWAGRFWWEWLLPFPFGRWPDRGDTAMLVGLSILMAPGLVLGVRALWKERGGALALASAAALAVWIGYSWLGVAYFWWYFAVPLGGIAMVAAVGVPRLARGPAVYVSAALMVVGMWTIAQSLYVGRWQEESQSFGPAARYLSTHALPGEKAMLEPIGMIGYTAPVTVVDEVGLVSPRVAFRRQRGAGWYADIATTERPEWLVLRYGSVRTGIGFAGRGAPFRSPAERDSLFARYQMVDAGAGNLRDESIVILRRVR